MFSDLKYHVLAYQGGFWLQLNPPTPWGAGGAHGLLCGAHHNYAVGSGQGPDQV